MPTRRGRKSENSQFQRVDTMLARDLLKWAEVNPETGKKSFNELLKDVNVLLNTLRDGLKLGKQTTIKELNEKILEGMDG